MRTTVIVQPGRNGRARPAGLGLSAALAAGLVAGLAVPGPAATASTATAASPGVTTTSTATPASPGVTTTGPAAVGQVRGWGDNSAGELGDGSTRGAVVPARTRLPLGTRVKAVSTGCGHTLAVTASGQLLAWGDNTFGELGDGTRVQRRRPVRVSLAAGTQVTAVSAGCFFSLALTAAGQVLSWGSDAEGEGGRQHGEKLMPVTLPLPGTAQAVAIGAGQDFGEAVTAGGRVYAWGGDVDGELGIGSRRGDRHHPVPVQLPAGTRVTALSVGGDHTLARTASGTVWAWGADGLGQLGDGTTGGSSGTVDIPVQIQVTAPGAPLGKLRALAAGGGTSLALFSSGAVLAWGDNEDGELGDGTSRRLSDVPVRVALPRGARVTAISAGSGDGYALTAAGRVLAWGRGDVGQLGDGRTAGARRPVTVRLAAGLQATAVSSGPAALHAFAIVRRP
jgi:alpha-tubulin suppressor-like RCC1 family protein